MKAGALGERFAVVIPAYREARRIGETVSAVRRYAREVVVVDDGSPDDTAAEAQRAGAHVLRHAVNRGKGAALNTAFAFAEAAGFDFVITMDGDGQHAAADLPGFVEAYRRSACGVIVGNRMAEAHRMPWVRRMTNRYMSRLLSREMGRDVPDTQCGYRLYGREAFGLARAGSTGFAAESENLLRLAQHGVKIGQAPVRVIYGDEHSKIHPFRDTIRFFRMLRRHRRRRRRAAPVNRAQALPG